MPSEAKHPAKRRKTSHKMPKPSRSLNTAKFSDEWRRIIRQRASVLKHDMRALYRTVVEDATPEAVLGLAAQIALPESTLQEDAAMQSPPSGWLPAAAPSGSTMPGYDGTRVVDEPFWKQWRKGEKKTGFQARSPLLDMCPEEIYSAQYLRLTREQRTRPKPSPSPTPRSSWKRRKDQDQDHQRTADADSDSGTDSEAGEEDGSGLDVPQQVQRRLLCPVARHQRPPVAAARRQGGRQSRMQQAGPRPQEPERRAPLPLEDVEAQPAPRKGPCAAPRRRRSRHNGAEAEPARAVLVCL